MTEASSLAQATLPTPVRRVGILHHPRIPQTLGLERELSDLVRAEGGTVWTASAWDQSALVRQMHDLDLVVTLGGDGTLLRAARSAAPSGVALLGVNFGRLGFLTELRSDDAAEGMRRILEGEGWLDRRAMLRVEVWRDGAHLLQTDGLNDCFVGRGGAPHTVHLDTRIDGAAFSAIAGDGLIVATPTGSTAYAVAAGGPILAPDTPALVLAPVAAHVLALRPLVTPLTAQIEIEPKAEPPSGLSVDGQINLDLEPGDCVRVACSPHQAVFIRLRPPTYFFETLLERLR